MCVCNVEATDTLQCFKWVLISNIKVSYLIYNANIHSIYCTCKEIQRRAECVIYILLNRTVI